jgi:predicted glutamine amidotransferase
MCRVFGCVASEQVSIGDELLRAPNPIVRQSQDHDSGWGMAVYARTDGADPTCVRFPGAAHSDGDFIEATELRGRIFNVHVRRATVGGLTLDNTHPFCLGNYSFGHNGTVLQFAKLLEPGVRRPAGQTDSEHLFNFLLHDYDPGDPIGSLRRAMASTAARLPFDGLNFLFSDGERLYAYRLGRFELHWLRRADRLLVASERVTDEPWHTLQQDVVLVLDPDDLDRPHAERLLGDELFARADIRKFKEGSGLRGAERGEFAAARAARAAHSSSG